MEKTGFVPAVIEGVVKDGKDVKVPHDTVLEELRNIAHVIDTKPVDLSMAMAVYMLGFSSYSGFKELLNPEAQSDDAMLKRLYQYAKHHE